ncbi:hypothetical protein JW813_01815 [Clostridium botulinum]|uniref:Yae1 family protein n=1 Tax=Clostridium TaxID=1485 RepID=UPI0013FBFBF7|nr:MULTISPECIES: Yae1 family protein [Clostridium]MCS6130829.1 hypothetical protein [Clostridium botulinum]NFL45404.1 hypothetical protein [Clostridium botulinum]NFL89104.1 hypothetical protein [Clostridium botulinum]UZP03786.1 hypothetical protein JW813_01815 [Clostridium botulinum]UZP07142.1 hypothetical protein JYA71_01810 [Clostridium botulinum]
MNYYYNDDEFNNDCNELRNNEFGDCEFTDYEESCCSDTESANNNSECRRCYKEGFRDGREKGYKEGFKDGCEKGFKEGREKGFKEGFKEGREKGYREGLKDGRENGFQEGCEVGFRQGYEKAIKDIKNCLNKKNSCC